MPRGLVDESVDTRRLRGHKVQIPEESQCGTGQWHDQKSDEYISRSCIMPCHRRRVTRNCCANLAQDGITVQRYGDECDELQVECVHHRERNESAQWVLVECCRDIVVASQPSEYECLERMLVKTGYTSPMGRGVKPTRRSFVASRINLKSSRMVTGCWTNAPPPIRDPGHRPISVTVSDHGFSTYQTYNWHHLRV